MATPIYDNTIHIQGIIVVTKHSILAQPDWRNQAEELWTGFFTKTSLTALISQFQFTQWQHFSKRAPLQLAYLGRNAVDSFDRQEFCNEVTGLVWTFPCLIRQRVFHHNWLQSLMDFHSQIPVITVTDALRKSETTAKQHDVLIAVEAIEVTEELQELFHFNTFDNGKN